MINKNKGIVKGAIFIFIITIIIFSISLLPIILAAYYLPLIIAFNKLWHFLLIPLLVYLGLLITVYLLILTSGAIIRIFRVRYEPGVYDYNYKDKMSIKWNILYFIHRPIRKLFEMFAFGETKNVYYRLLGMKVGKNTIINGTIVDPCLTEVGDNCIVGSSSFIYCHIHDLKKGTITINRVKIGNNCVIGDGAIIMPGVILEDDIIIGAGAVVPKNKILKKGKTYVGVPAKEIKTKKDK